MAKSDSKDRSRDTGEALVLFSLLVYAKLQSSYILVLAIVLLVACMAKPALFKPIAPFWFGLGEWLGRISSFIILTVVFFVIVVPVAIVQRVAGRDALRLKLFKRGTGSVFVNRNHEFKAEDLENSF